jgi:branched-chain amino acid transport system permease protein
MYVLIGGIGSFTGPIIGTTILMMIPEISRKLTAFVPFISAAILLIVAYVMPQGLIGLPQIARSWFTEHPSDKRLTYDS